MLLKTLAKTALLHTYGRFCVLQFAEILRVAIEFLAVQPAMHPAHHTTKQMEL